MARSAKLTSIDAVREMAVALTLFGDEAIAALDDLDVNVRRAVEWIEHDRKDYWENEVRRGWERVGEARAELEKALTYRKVADRRPSCRQERAMLEKAKRRVRIAEEKHRSLAHWSHAIDHAVRELTGAKNLLVDWLHGELPHALNTLKQMTISLETYAASRQPARTEAAAATTSGTEQGAPPEGTEEKEKDDENLGSAHARRETTPGDEGSEGG